MSVCEWCRQRHAPPDSPCCMRCRGDFGSWTVEWQQWVGSPEYRQHTERENQAEVERRMQGHE